MIFLLQNITLNFCVNYTLEMMGLNIFISTFLRKITVLN
uniref:Uncharacterized protein n=1 Tax=Anguilla anguilla TaxID=7936 RepID=A0A0E9VEU2_ANGAN